MAVAAAVAAGEGGAVVPAQAAVAADSRRRLPVQVLPQPGQVPPRLGPRQRLGLHLLLARQRVLVPLGARLALGRQPETSRGLVPRPVR